MPFDKISRGIFVGLEDAKMGYGHKKRSNALGTFIKYYKISQLIHTQIIAN